ncbi:site-specific integrase [Streptomyces sp. KAU_LT]|uniref:tyrosine-type recombinase/integrase n=1 Tax=Streptomyces sp. KAU_LT TaxID=3046669 RepID=UPI0024B7E452|nr:site-specific integrase [Streptomyces sp. KAU_LT]MDI9836203.1 site-specific integrase [Streptomyces sp. KAU_LT]
MAYVKRMTGKDGSVTSYRVRWRLGGARDGAWQSERFEGDEAGAEAAEVFCQAVNDAGQQWPPGWVKGEGYIDPGAGVEESYLFRSYARAVIAAKTGVEERYRQDCLRELEQYLEPTFGNCDVRSTEHFSKATVAAWVNKMAQTYVWRGSKRKLMSPKTLRNVHGLLSSILSEAVNAEPPLRERNPCRGIRLPRTDDEGALDDERTEDMEFMTPDEVAGLVSCFKRPEDQVLVRVAYGTGMRWGEITALAARHARNPSPGVFELAVSRAWKRRPRTHPQPGAYLGTPKSRASRRVVDISAGLWQELLAHGLAGLGKDALIFHNGHGERLVYSTFYERWVAAVSEARDRGLLAEHKYPTFHDLRHSHVAALLSDGHSMELVKRRLGHESIKTTSDRYGHLLREAHEGALSTIDRALRIPPSTGLAGAAEEVEEHEARTPVAAPGRSLYVAYVGARMVGFWRPEHAEELAERWARERGGAVRVERMSADWWVRSTGGQVGHDNGLKAVREELPARALVWSLGPALYDADGQERTVNPGAHQPASRWTWDFEDAYTEEPSHSVTEWRPGQQALTEARAWGLDQEAVQAAYAVARADAVRTCGFHPERGAGERQAVS